MSVYTSAEFDSVDMADLAAGRVRKIDGILNTQVEKNRFDKNGGERDETPAFIPGAAGWPYSGGMSAGPFYTLPAASAFDSETGGHFEPEHRRDVLLRVKARDDRCAGKAASVLRNLGGHDVCITRE